MRSETSLRCSLRSESSHSRQLEILIAASKFVEANGIKRKELLVQGERFVDSWIKETFIWILAAFVQSKYYCKLELSGVSALEYRAGNLSQSAIAWSSYSAAMVSISSYEIDRRKLRPNFQCVKVHES